MTEPIGPETIRDVLRAADGMTVVVAGATSAAGRATVLKLADAGAKVIAVSSSEQRLADAFASDPRVDRYGCDLTDPTAVQVLARTIHSRHGGTDALIHLVGGWRGGQGISAQSDADYEFLHRSIFRTLFNTTRAFQDQLIASLRGRVVIVSASVVESPLAASAAYSAVKASAETWIQAVAEEFSRTSPTAAAAILVVKSLVSADERTAAPERRFPGHTDVGDLAHAVLVLLAGDASAINGRRIPVTSPVEAGAVDPAGPAGQ